MAGSHQRGSVLFIMTKDTNSKEVLDAYKPARNVESARVVKRKMGGKVPHIKSHKSKKAHNLGI